MRFVFRFASFLALLAAITVGGLDAVRYVASDKVDFTGFGALLAFLGIDRPEAGAQAGGFVAALEHSLLAAPAVAVVLAASLVLWLPGYRRPRPAVSRAARQA